MAEPTPHETRERVTESGIERSIVDAVMQVASNAAAYGVPTAYVTGKVVDAVKSIRVGRVQADAAVEVARPENGYPMDGGAHRSDD